MLKWLLIDGESGVVQHICKTTDRFLLTDFNEAKSASSLKFRSFCFNKKHVFIKTFSHHHYFYCLRSKRPKLLDCYVFREILQYNKRKSKF